LNQADKKEKAIIVFARLPVEGKVKTRLAKDIGNKNAASFYNVCADHILSEVRKVKESGVGLFLFYSDKNEDGDIKNWVGDDFYFHSQLGDDLGTRMLNAFRLVFKEGYKKIIIVGTDVPDIDSALLLNAFNELNENEFVIGPSEDGGYYLLGMKTLTVDVFEDMKWGKETVFDSTIEKLDNKKARYKILRKLVDIDTKQDLLLWFHKSGADNPVKKFVESIK